MDKAEPEDDQNSTELEARTAHATIRSAKYAKWALALAFLGFIYMLATDLRILTVETNQDGKTSMVFDPGPFEDADDFAVGQWNNVTDWWNERERQQAEEERREEQKKQEARQERIDEYGEFRAGQEFKGLALFFLVAAAIAIVAVAVAGRTLDKLSVLLGSYLVPLVGYLVLFWPALGGIGVFLSILLWLPVGAAAAVAYVEEDLRK